MVQLLRDRTLGSDVEGIALSVLAVLIMGTLSNVVPDFDAAKKAAEKEGGRIQAWYLTMGHYDAVLISEFPSDEACAMFTLSAGALGNISTETLKAFSEGDYRKIVGSL